MSYVEDDLQSAEIDFFGLQQQSRAPAGHAQIQKCHILTCQWYGNFGGPAMAGQSFHKIARPPLADEPILDGPEGNKMGALLAKGHNRPAQIAGLGG